MIDLKEISKSMWAVIGGIVVLAGVVGGTVGSLTYLKTEFAPIALAVEVDELEECATKLEEESAKKKDLQKLVDEVAAWKLEDKALAIQKRLWYLEQQFGCPRCPAQIGEYRRLQHELSLIMRKLQGYYKPPIELNGGSS